MKIKGFSLIEILVVIAIIGMLATIAVVTLSGARNKAGDTKRINDLAQLGRFLSFGCPTMPDGTGQYDLNELIVEFQNNYPQFDDNIPENIKDPKTGTDDQSNYKYIIDENKNCALYANLENSEAETDLNISQPTPGGGTGIFEGSEQGWNGSNKYYQISN